MDEATNTTDATVATNDNAPSFLVAMWSYFTSLVSTLTSYPKLLGAAALAIVAWSYGPGLMSYLPKSAPAELAVPAQLEERISKLEEQIAKAVDGTQLLLAEQEPAKIANIDARLKLLEASAQAPSMTTGAITKKPSKK